MTSRSERIAAKLRAVADRPELADTFGAQAHRFRLRPPLSEAEVAAAEAAHRVRLPREYRRFLIESGDGGAGPSYGLIPLAEAFDSVDGDVTAPDRLTPDEPCRVTDDDDASPYDGLLPLVHHGCGHYSSLVLAGPARGRVVDIGEFDEVPLPAADPGFDSWYERWLDELAAGYNVTNFSQRLPGDEPVLLRHVATEADPVRRRRAVSSLLKLPRLTEAAVPVLAEAADGADRELRRAVLAVIGGANCPALLPVAERALNAADPVIRAAALDTLRFAAPPDLAHHARGRLADAAPKVVWAALLALQTGGELTAADLAPLLDDPRDDVRGSARYFAGKL